MYTIAAIKQVSETSYFLCRNLNHTRTVSVASATNPKTKVVMTSWCPIGSRLAMLTSAPKIGYWPLDYQCRGWMFDD